MLSTTEPGGIQTLEGKKGTGIVGKENGNKRNWNSTSWKGARTRHLFRGRRKKTRSIDFRREEKRPCEGTRKGADQT